MVAEALPVPPKPPSDPAQVRNAADILRRGLPTLIVLGGEAVRAEALENAHRIAAATGARLIAPGRQRADLARPGPGAGGSHPLRRGYRGEGAGRHAARHPVRAAQAGDVLRLSEQADHADPGGRRHPRARAARPGRRRGAGAAGRRTRRAARRHPRSRPAAGAGARQADPEVRRRHAVRAAAGAGGGHRRGGHLRPRLLPVHLRRRAARLAELHRRRDRLRPAAGHRRRGRRARPARGRAAGRRLGDVHAAGAVDQAREKLDVTTVLLSNRKYQILLGELANVGANPGRTALDMLDLGNPDLDWPNSPPAWAWRPPAPRPASGSPTCSQANGGRARS